MSRNEVLFPIFFWTWLFSLKLTARPWKWWFPLGISFSKGLFSGAMLVSGRVIFNRKQYTYNQFWDTSNNHLIPLSRGIFCTALSQWAWMSSRANWHLFWRKRRWPLAKTPVFFFPRGLDLPQDDIIHIFRRPGNPKICGPKNLEKFATMGFPG